MLLNNQKLLFAVMLLGLGFIFVTFGSHGIALHNILGAAVAVLSLVLWFIARQQLGKSFSVTAQAHQLVTHGLYSRIRNPVYVFGALFIFGIIIYAGRYWALLIFFPLIPTQIVRARREAKVLEAAFGEQYREYRRGTWF